MLEIGAIYETTAEMSFYYPDDCQRLVPAKTRLVCLEEWCWDQQGTLFCQCFLMNDIKISRTADKVDAHWRLRKINLDLERVFLEIEEE